MLPKLVMGSAVGSVSKADISERPKRKSFKQTMVEKGGNAVTTFEIAKATKGFSK